MRKIQRFIDSIALRGTVYFKDDTGKEIVGVVIEHLKDNNFLIKSKEGTKKLNLHVKQDLLKPN